MEKITVTERKELDHWEGVNQLHLIKDQITKLEADGFTHIEFEAVGNDSAWLNIRASKKRLETDEEFKSRVELEAIRLDKIKERELQTYHELKAKYNL